MKRMVVSLVLLVLMAGALHAQTQSMEYEESSGLAMALAGLGAGTAAFVMGFAVGVDLADEDDEFFGGVDEGFFLGSALGAVFLGAGVHAANEARGDAAGVILASAATGAGGIVLAGASGTFEVLYLTVAAQLAVAVLTEKHTARTKYEATHPNLALWRTREGAPGLALSVTF